MSWARFILLVFIGFTLHGAYGQQIGDKDRKRGSFIGELKTLNHQVSGKVWAVDEDKLYIENFTFDGKSQDTFFWIGNGSQPNPKGRLIRYPLSTIDEKPVGLKEMDGVDILLHLPPRVRITDMDWFSVWCRRFTVDNGHVIIPPDLEPPRKRVLPEFQRLAHDLRSGNITILDARTFYIPNLHYDGRGPDAYFWVGNGTQPDPNGHKIPNEMGSLEVLRAYEGEDIELQLPENLTVYDIDYLGVWCVTFKHNFGHVQIPHSDLWVPPALGQTRVKPEDILEAYSGNDRDVYQIEGVEFSSNDPSRVHHNQPSSTDCPSSGLAPQLNNGSCPDSQDNMDAGASSTFTLPSHHLVLTLPALTLAVFSSFSSFNFLPLSIATTAAATAAATLSLL